MNWKLFVFIWIALAFVYEMLLQFVKIRSSANPIPKNLEGLYDEQTYARWRAYRKELGILSTVFAVAGFVINTALLMTNAYAAFARLFPAGFFWQLFAVMLLDTLVSAAVGVVQGYISNMVIEEKYGFNRTTVKTFVIDVIRDFLVSLCLWVGVVTVFAALYRALGDWVLLLCLGVFFCLLLLILFLHPFLSRMGNKFVPLEAGELREKLEALMAKYGYQVRAIEVMDGSKRSTRANAYFTGFGKMKTIVLFDTMLQTMSVDEVCAVFAHELGHGRNKDTLKGMIPTVFQLAILILLAWLGVKLEGLQQAFGFAEINYGFAYVLMTVFLLLYGPAYSMLSNVFTRHQEYRADRAAVADGYGPALIQALKKLSKDGFAHLSPAKFQVIMEYSHPPLSQRIAAIEKAMEE